MKCYILAKSMPIIFVLKVIVIIDLLYYYILFDLSIHFGTNEVHQIIKFNSNFLILKYKAINLTSD